MLRSLIYNFLKDFSIKVDNYFIVDKSLKINNVFALTFHSVHLEKDKHNLSKYLNPKSSISINKLDEFINFFLKKNIKFINTNNIKSKDLSNNNIILSFDDGYYNNHLLIDLVNKYNIPIEVFVSTSFIESQNLFWWDIMFNSAKNPEKFKHLNHSKLIKLSNNMFKKKMFSDINRPFTINELKSFSQNENILIGNHTHSHIINNKINSEFFFRDVKIAQDKLKNWLGYAPHSFAFPNGNCLSNEFEQFNKIGLFFNFKVLPNQFSYLEINKNIALPRFMFSSDENIIKLFNAILKNGMTLKSLKLNYFLKSLIQTNV